MRELKRFDRQEKIQLVDIQQHNFQTRWPNIDQKLAMQKIHGELNGKTITGLDVTYHAWRLVGKKHRVSWLKWPLIKPVADTAYLAFAKHRQCISKILAPWLPAVDKNCDVCQSKLK